MMREMTTQGRIAYFGKIPSRNDFIKAADDVALMGVLDDWMAQVMAALPSDPRWKLRYDALAPVQFAFVGPRRKHAIAGRIVASSDHAGRRFPFLMMRTLELADPAAFLPLCPMMFAPLWARMAGICREVLAAPEPAGALQAIPETVVGLDDASPAGLATFEAQGTVSSLGALLGMDDLRRMLLALGMVLQPVMASGSADLDKALVLPLPALVSARAAVAAYWLGLVAPFLGRADFELALFFTELEQRPVMVVGFRGASAHTLHGIIDPQVGQEQQVSFDDTSWVDDQLDVDVDVRRLASYLDQPELPLAFARELFLQTFVGDAS
jgi:type VI secretion system protein ImpM